VKPEIAREGDQMSWRQREKSNKMRRNPSGSVSAWGIFQRNGSTTPQSIISLHPLLPPNRRTEGGERPEARMYDLQKQRGFKKDRYGERGGLEMRRWGVRLQGTRRER